MANDRLNVLEQPYYTPILENVIEISSVFASADLHASISSELFCRPGVVMGQDDGSPALAPTVDAADLLAVLYCTCKICVWVVARHSYISHNCS